MMERERALRLLRERIVGFAASHLSRDAAEDIAQEVLVVLEEKYAHVSAAGELAPLAIRIARFKVLGVRRKAARRGEYGQVSVEDVPLPDTRHDPYAALERREMLDRLKSALAKTGERCRELFRLKLQGKTFAEIQAAMGVKALNTIYTWDHRCRKHMLELLGGTWEGRR
jgi:RNA polymerase sigma-70 factor (ECF subfamily)